MVSQLPWVGPHPKNSGATMRDATFHRECTRVCGTTHTISTISTVASPSEGSSEVETQALSLSRFQLLPWCLLPVTTLKKDGRCFSLNGLGLPVLSLCSHPRSHLCGCLLQILWSSTEEDGAGFLVMVVLSALWFCDTPADRAYFVGLCSAAITSGVYLLPTGIIVWNRMSNNIEPTPMPPIIIGPAILRAGVWLLYSILVGKGVMIIPTGVGFLAGCFHGSVYIYYTHTPTGSPTRQLLVH